MRAWPAGFEPRTGRGTLPGERAVRSGGLAGDRPRACEGAHAFFRLSAERDTMSLADLRSAGVDRSPIAVGAAAGLIAGVPTGVVLQLGTDVLSLLGMIVGTGSPVVGWALHLALSAVFGALFGWHVEWPVFRTLTDTMAGAVMWGVIFGVVWYAYLMIGIVIPGVVELVWGSGEGAPFPVIPGPTVASLNAAVAFALAYVLYGVVLGGSYAVLEDASAEPEPRGPGGEGA